MWTPASKWTETASIVHVFFTHPADLCRFCALADIGTLSLPHPGGRELSHRLPRDVRRVRTNISED